MSADELRQAAERLRDPYRCNTAAYESALADWLERTGDRHTDESAVTKEECNRTACCSDGCEVQYCGACGELDYGEACSERLDALAVARIINGGTP